MNPSNIDKIIHVDSRMMIFRVPIVRSWTESRSTFYPDFDVEDIYLEFFVGQIFRFGYGTKSKILVIGDL